jgi:YidC/Oxa1 family membrane protein insertase
MFFAVFTQPVLNALVWLYGVLPWADMGLTIVVFTVLIKLVLWPLNRKALQGQKAMQAIQPKIKALQAEYKDRPQELAQATMQLYKSERVNPFASCLPVLVQIPVLLGVFSALRLVVGGESVQAMYAFVPHPEHIRLVSFGTLDLAGRSVVLALLTGVAQFWQARTMSAIRPLGERQKNLLKRLEDTGEVQDATADENMAQAMTRSMTYTLPIVTVIAGMTISSGVVLYWFVSTLMTIVQQGITLGWKSKPQA